MTTLNTNEIAQEQLQHIPAECMQYVENFKKLGEWKGIKPSQLIGNHLAVGYTDGLIVGLSSSRATAKLVVIDVEDPEDVFNLTYKQVEVDLKLAGIIKI